MSADVTPDELRKVAKSLREIALAVHDEGRAE